MKYTSYIFFATLLLLLSACRDDAFDITSDPEIEHSDPTEKAPEIVFSVVDGQGNILHDTELSLYMEGELVAHGFSNVDGELTVEMPINEDGEIRALLHAKKHSFGESMLRIENQHLIDKHAQIVMDKEEDGLSFGTSNLGALLTSSVVMIDGDFQAENGDPRFVWVYIAEPQVIFENDTTGFSDVVQVDENGYFSMLVPADTELVYAALLFDPCSPFIFTTINEPDILVDENAYVEEIGPFMEDTTFPTNTNGPELGEFPLNVTGRTLDCQGNALPFASVQLFTIGLFGEEFVGQVQSDSDGNFETDVVLCGPGQGYITAKVSAEGFLEEVFNAVFTEDDPNAAFGDMINCTSSYLSLEGSPIASLNLTNIVIEDYIEGESLLVGLDESSTNTLVIDLVEDSPGFWIGNLFEYYQGENLIYRSTGPFAAALQDDGQKITVHFPIMAIEIFAGQNAGEITNFINGEMVLVK